MITYKTIIANAIAHFNDIQTELYTLGAKRADGSTAITAVSGTLVPTDEFDTIIREQLQLKATGTYTLTDNTGTTDVSQYKYVKAQAASGFTLELIDKGNTDVSVGTVNSGYYPITASLSGTLTAATAGWFTSGAATDESVIVGRIKQGSLNALSSSEVNDTLVVTSTYTAGYLTNTSKTYTVAAATFQNGSGTASISVDENTANITGATNIYNNSTISLTKPTSGYFYGLDIVASGSGSVTSASAGYVVNGKNVGTASVSGSKTAYVKIDSAAGTVNVNSPTIAPGAVQLVDVADDNGVSAALGDIYANLGSITTTKPTSGYYLSLKQNSKTLSSVITAGANISANGYITTDYAFTNVKGNITISESSNYYVPVAAAKLSNSATTGVTYIENNDVAVDIKDGYLYINSGYIPNTKISLGALIPDIDNDANASYILNGYKAFDENGKLITGTMGTWTPSTTYFTTNSTLGVTNGVVSKGLYTGGSDNYIIKGSATAPATISGTGSTVSVNSGTITLTKTVSVTPTVTKAGWVDSGTAGNSTVTLTGAIATTELKKSNASCAVTNNTTSPSASGGDAVVSDGTTSPFDTYVVVRASSTGTASVGTGYISEGSVTFNANDTARIAAAVNPTVTNGTPTASLTLSTASTFDSTSGSVTSAYTSAQTATISAVNVLSNSNNYKDKYIVGTFTAKTNSGTATVTVGEDVTGSSVDHYAEQLYKRILGKTYEEVAADA